MRTLKKMVTIVVMLTICGSCALGDDDAANRNRAHRHGPPPEAYTACEGKSVGDTAAFESPHGDTVTGTCVMEGDRLVLRPDTPPPGAGRGNRTEE